MAGKLLQRGKLSYLQDLLDRVEAADLASLHIAGATAGIMVELRELEPADVISDSLRTEWYHGS